MKVSSCTVGLALILGIGSSVQADMSNPWSVVNEAHRVVPKHVSTTEHRPAVTDFYQFTWPATDVYYTYCFTGPLGLAGDTGQQTVKELPPAPDSAVLFLCGMGTLGAWRLTRSARKLHFGNIPAWFHSGGPCQIGHSHALNPDCIDPWSLCWVDRVAGAHPVLFDYLPSEAQPHFNTLRFLAAASPRAPPVVP